MNKLTGLFGWLFRNKQSAWAAETYIDSRLKWIRLTAANTIPRYAVTHIGFQDEAEARGQVNVYIEVRDENGAPAFGVPVRFNTMDGENEAIQHVINGATDFPMSGDSSFAPDRNEIRSLLRRGGRRAQ